MTTMLVMSKFKLTVIPVVLGATLMLSPYPVSAQGEEIEPRATVFEIPDHAEQATAKKGETIVAKARVYVYSGIKLASQINGKQRGGSGAGRPTATIVPQYLIARSEDKRWTYYTGNVIYDHAGATNVTGELGSGSIQNRVGGLRISKDDPADVEIWVRRHTGRGFYFEEPLDLEEATIGAGDELSTAQELAYDGIDGDMLRIIYREHAGTSTEPAHEEQFVVDISGGSEVNVKGARIEVLAADPGALRYRVLQNFE